MPAALQQSEFSNLETSSNRKGMVKIRGLQLEQAFFLEGVKEVIYCGRWSVEGLCAHSLHAYICCHLQTPVQLSDFDGVKDRDYAVMWLLTCCMIKQDLAALKGGPSTPIILHPNKSISALGPDS